MVYLVIILFLFAGILIWYGSRIDVLEKRIEGLNKLLNIYQGHIETLCHELSEEFDENNVIFDNIYTDIKIIRQHVGLDLPGEAIEKSSDDVY